MGGGGGGGGERRGLTTARGGEGGCPLLRKAEKLLPLNRPDFVSFRMSMKAFRGILDSHLILM